MSKEFTATVPQELRALGLALLLAAQPAFADSTQPRTTIELSAEASQPAANDQALAVMFIEASDSDPAALAQRVNARLSAALQRSKAHPEVRTRSGNLSTYPVYAKNGGRIENWRMRAELQLESRNLAALSALVGQLQDDLAIRQLALQPAPETRAQAQDQATQQAIEAFRQRATAIAANLGKPYRIVHLSVGGGYTQPPMRALARMESAPLPIEAGESLVQVSINGKIELIE